MGLVHVHEKSNPDRETWVDEEWLTRWPDDFKLVNPRKPERLDPATDSIPIQPISAQY